MRVYLLVNDPFGLIIRFDNTVMHRLKAPTTVRHKGNIAPEFRFDCGRHCALSLGREQRGMACIDSMKPTAPAPTSLVCRPICQNASMEIL